MDIQFVVIDIFDRIITCSEDVWINHVLYNHPEIELYESRVIEILQYPDLGVFRDKRYGNREIFYGDCDEENQIIKIVLEFTENNSLITAFFEDYIKEDMNIWKPRGL